MASKWFKALKKWRKYLILLLTPIILSPLPLALQDKVWIGVVFYNKLPWFVSELPQKYIKRGGPV
jgi:hypothetical protein